MKRKIVALFMTCTLGATLLTGCGDIASAFSSDDKEDVDENADDESDKKDSDKDAKDGKTDDSSSKASDEKEDDSKDNDGSDAEGLKVPESEEELFAFMEGEWDFVNPVTLEDYAHMEIDDKGSFVYGYTGSKESCTGEFVANHLYVEEDVPLTFTVNVSGLDGMTFEYSGYVVEDEDSSDGKIYYGSCDGEDYIYMEETGNGDTFAGSVLFQDPNTVDGSFHMGSNSYIMHRESAADTTAELKDGEFYA